MKERTIKEAVWYLDLIDHMLDNYLKLKISRYDVQWGEWSREMNIDLRKKEQRSDLMQEIFVQVFGYWVLASKLLELHYKYPQNFLKRRRKRILKKELSDLRKDISKGKIVLVEGDIRQKLGEGLQNGIN